MEPKVATYIGPNFLDFHYGHTVDVISEGDTTFLIQPHGTDAQIEVEKKMLYFQNASVKD